VSVIGAPREWLDLVDQMVPQVLGLLISTWEGMPPPDPMSSEDRITDELWRALIRNRDVRRLPFKIRTQVVELAPAEGAGGGRMDIIFDVLVPREDIYFCLECKRLNVPQNGGIRANATEYVRAGMLRFVSGRYSNAVRHGGMIAYVINGDVQRAIRNVEANVRRNADSLRMLEPAQLRPSTVLKGDSRARETLHQRLGESATFTIHHMFMAPAAIADPYNNN
jgi:hypothetical protein